MPTDVVIRPPLWGRVYVCVFAVVATWFLLSDLRPWEKNASAWLPPGVFLVFLAVLASGLFLQRARATTDGVLSSRGILPRTKSWRKEQIAEFRDASGPQTGMRTVYVLLKDGSMDPLPVTTSPTFLRRRRESQLEQLRTWLGQG